MIASSAPLQRAPDAKLLVVDAHGGIRHAPRAALAQLLRASDLVVANDAATLPASLRGWHVPSGACIEVRLAGRRSLKPDDVRWFSAVVFGAGDFHTRTEDRPPPPPIVPHDRLALGPLYAIVERLLDHPRQVLVRFEGSPATVWEGLAQHGLPIQYMHLPDQLALWDVWTPIAGPPVAFEPPSAGFVLSWEMLTAMRRRGIGFATLTHAAGISSTGDAELDARLPFDEPYLIPDSTVRAIRRAQCEGGRVVAIGTTVVRALEHSASRFGTVGAGPGIATQRIGPHTRLAVVDALVSGAHEPGTSHYELLRAFTDDATLRQATKEFETHRYRTHEFGDSVLIERRAKISSVDTGPGQLVAA